METLIITVAILAAASIGYVTGYSQAKAQKLYKQYKHIVTSAGIVDLEILKKELSVRSMNCYMRLISYSAEAVMANEEIKEFIREDLATARALIDTGKPEWDGEHMRHVEKDIEACIARKRGF